MAGFSTRFATDVGPLEVPRGLISPAIFYHLVTHDYELPELTLLDQHLHGDDRVIELGAGLGFLANRYGRRCPQQHHLAIEANPVMSALARRNTVGVPNVDVLNGLAARAATGSGATAPTVPFYVYRDFWASSTEPVHLHNPALRLLRTEAVPAGISCRGRLMS